MAMHKNMLSPESIMKDSNKLAKDFAVILEFEDACEACSSTETDLEHICENCRNEMKEEIEHWREAKHIIEEHMQKGPKGRELIKS